MACGAKLKHISNRRRNEGERATARDIMDPMLLLWHAVSFNIARDFSRPGERKWHQQMHLMRIPTTRRGWHRRATEPYSRTSHLCPWSVHLPFWEISHLDAATVLSSHLTYTTYQTYLLYVSAELTATRPRARHRAYTLPKQRLVATPGI